jgi:hypothetical protein
VEIVWFNDTNATQTIYFDHFMDSPKGVVSPQAMVLLEYPLPENKALFIKQWTNHIVLVGAIDPRLV